MYPTDIILVPFLLKIRLYKKNSMERTIIRIRGPANLTGADIIGASRIVRHADIVINMTFTVDC